MSSQTLSLLLGAMREEMTMVIVSNLEQKVTAEGHRAESDAAISARPLKAHETQKEDTMTATIPAELDMKTAGRVENYLDRIKRSFEPNYDGNLSVRFGRIERECRLA